MKTRTLPTQCIGLGAALVLLSACGNDTAAQDAQPTSSAPQASAAAPVAQLGATTTALGNVVTDAAGYTLYWFTQDTPTSSACVGQCATTWPPTLGAPRAAAGTDLPGALGTLTRPDGGAQQAVYDGRPLYRFAKDDAPGQTNGEGVKGQWHVALVTPAPVAPPTAGR
ncbi:COG4315 family predicted lipoprotein [Nocardia sp. CA-107356]|uniref:COG4315 family predicted lipoprotein n=1 Tax=Nocardia sp. CA-107356 TaxID=3239972 RepID=UPI003D8DB039